MVLKLLYDQRHFLQILVKHPSTNLQQSFEGSIWFLRLADSLDIKRARIGSREVFGFVFLEALHTRLCSGDNWFCQSKTSLRIANPSLAHVNCEKFYQLYIVLHVHLSPQRPTFVKIKTLWYQLNRQTSMVLTFMQLLRSLSSLNLCYHQFKFVLILWFNFSICETAVICSLTFYLSLVTSLSLSPK